MKKFHYNCVGTCSDAIDIVLDDEDRLVSAVFTGGCNGNLQGIGRLVQGMKREDVIARLRQLVPVVEVRDFSLANVPTAHDPIKLASAIEGVSGWRRSLPR